MEVKKIERLGELKDKIFAKGTFIVFDLNDPSRSNITNYKASS